MCVHYNPRAIVCPVQILCTHDGRGELPADGQHSLLKITFWCASSVYNVYACCNNVEFSNGFISIDIGQFTRNELND